jgi:hypothetical protein
VPGDKLSGNPVLISPIIQTVDYLYRIRIRKSLLLKSDDFSGGSNFGVNGFNDFQFVAGPRH